MERRTFITSTIKSAGALTWLSMEAKDIAGKSPSSKTSYTVQAVIDLIMKEGGLTSIKDTVDTIKIGRPEQTVSGIITTMFPTIPVIEEAVRRDANFIIAHEPSFYNHRDDRNWVSNNSVLLEKLALLEKHHIAIWRFHDYCHALKPDAIMYGVVKKANWLPYYKPGETDLRIPATTLQKLVEHLKASLGITHLRILGDLNQACERITILPGAWGGQRQVSAANIGKPDVLIVGEASEWETVEYIRDCRSLGHKISLIVLGHAVSEEPGMEWFVDWLHPKLEGISIAHVTSGDPFTWL
jgi:putative NIF3 family GTP cyclohydrolase 1 type 2